jgi:hypothetical protein
MHREDEASASSMGLLQEGLYARQSASTKNIMDLFTGGSKPRQRIVAIGTQTQNRVGSRNVQKGEKNQRILSNFLYNLLSYTNGLSPYLEEEELIFFIVCSQAVSERSQFF